MSTTLKTSAYKQQTTDVWLVLITLTHADLAAPIRVVANTESITSNGETFSPWPVAITLPDQREDAPARGRVEIDNVSRELGEAVRTITSPATVKFEFVRAADPDTVEESWDYFQLRNVKWDAGKLSGDLMLEDFTSEPYPAGTFTPAGFPGLF